MNDPQPWFAPKRFGYGAGRPIAWQGWALISSYLVVIALVAWLDQQTDGRVRVVGFVLFVAATATFVALVLKRTDGELKWRWGKRD